MRRAGGLHLVLFVGLFAVGLVLLALGFDLGTVDLWLDEHAGLFDAIGSRLFRVLCGGVLAICAIIVGLGLWQNFVAPTRTVEEADRFGLVGILVAALVGYFAWFGMMG